MAARLRETNIGVLSSELEGPYPAGVLAMVLALANAGLERERPVLGVRRIAV